MKSSSQSSSEKKIEKTKMSEEPYDKFRLLYESHPLIHITINFDGIITSINKNGAKELGYLTNELIDSHISKLFIPQDAARLEKQIQYVLLNPDKQSPHEMKMLRKNKQEFWVRETIYTTEQSSLTKEIFFCI